MKIAIVGSRGFHDLHAVREFVRKLPGDTVVVSGGGDERRRYLPRHKWGVDEVAEDEAQVRGLTVESYPAQWERPDGTINRGAGFARNGLIAANSDCVVAFWDGKSRGTKDTIDKAKRLHRPVKIIS